MSSVPAVGANFKPGPDAVPIARVKAGLEGRHVGCFNRRPEMNELLAMILDAHGGIERWRA